MFFSFFKMNGAGNDFIIIDDRSLNFPLNNRALIKKITCHKNGIGSDGLILFQPSKKADIRMRFFNPDGLEVDMCGNGIRCLSRLSSHLNITSNNSNIETNSGIIKTIVNNDLVEIYFKLNSLIQRDLLIDNKYHVDAYNSGVPHVVLWVQNINGINIEKIGSLIRNNKYFFPNGTNVTFATVIDQNTLSIRTYERGVEAETLACGTGAIAASVISVDRNLCTFPILVNCKSGDFLKVNKFKDEIILEGKTVFEFQGEWKNGTWV